MLGKNGSDYGIVLMELLSRVWPCQIKASGYQLETMRKMMRGTPRPGAPTRSWQMHGVRRTLSGRRHRVPLPKVQRGARRRHKVRRARSGKVNRAIWKAWELRR